MKSCILVTLLHVASVLASPSTTSPTRKGCNILSQKYGSATFFPGSDRYDFENEYGWTPASWLGPACIFTPHTSAMVSFAVKTFSENNIKFAVRGGGAMPLANAANIGSEGILIANTNFTSMDISYDKSMVSFGAGVRWPALYSYLDNYNVTVNGIRIGEVGVVGMLLGGGIGFFSYEHGMASTSVQSFECVLSDGTIIETSLSQHEDLFWALRGGGNNFCIVTRATMWTIDVSTVQLATVSYGSGQKVQDRYIKSLVEFSRNAQIDPKASMEGQIRWTPDESPDITFDGFLSHNSVNDKTPLGLQNWTDPVFTPTSGNLTQMTMGKWINMFPYDQIAGTRKFFHMFSIPANHRAMEICVDTYYKTIAELSEVQNFTTALTIMPITSNVIAQSSKNGGNPLGLNEHSVPALWLVESPVWSKASDTHKVNEAHDRANEAIEAALAAEGFRTKRFIYLNDASKSQLDDVFPSFGKKNVEKLQTIRDKYDPASVYTKLLPGGAKVAFADV